MKMFLHYITEEIKLHQM